ncbi:hypothetical protein BD560DRAFT_328368 [Blakeslea trispora]|nr:hypothetical protein BD560DRAFT_328368 [Blakeslea trispora]
MSHNQLKGTVVVKSNTIEMLDLSHNNINGIEFSDGSNLSKLNVSYNELEELPVAFRNWKRLQDLDISQNRLMCLFPATIVLNALVRLNASKNSILTMVEGDQTQVVLPKLVELVLSTNKLNEAGLGGLVNTPQLQTLDVSSNQLQNIPTAIIHLTQLTRLDVRGNQLRTLPYELGKLDFLKIVHCEGNPMRSFTSMTPTQLIESLRSNYQQQQLQENDSQQQDALANMHVSVVEEMSQQFERKVNLAQRLDLSNKQLNEVSEQELQLQQDVPGTIMLDHNQLTVFPSLLHGLSDFLVTLVLDHNRLSSFSFSIENIVFQQLKTLKLNNNRIKTLECNSHQISFPKLEELSLSHNALTTLPDTMAVGLPSLRIFLASSNKLDDLTEKPFNQRLEILDLSNNDIGSLPSGLSTLESLKELIVFGIDSFSLHRFRVPRPAVVEQGTKAVLEFLKRRHNSSA